MSGTAKTEKEGETVPQLTYGQRVVGLDRPVSDDDAATAVQRSKMQHANVIDQLDAYRSRKDATEEQKRLTAIAIERAITSSMWSTRALTYKD